MAYDAVSNRTLLGDTTGRYTTLYDALDRARAVANPLQDTISYSFDAAGRRATMTEPDGGRFTYGYSPTDLNTSVINPQGQCTTWQYDANSRVTIQLLANLIRVSYAYDNNDRLLRLANLTSAGATITSGCGLRHAHFCRGFLRLVAGERSRGTAIGKRRSARAAA
jgi:YD repeat-containing protein